MKIELVDDVNDDMTTQTYIGQNLDSVVTDDDKNKNDITPPVSEVSSLMSLLSQINMNDPDAGDKLVMAAAKSIEAKCAEQGTPITPFEEFCKQQEEKERKKKKRNVSSSTYLLLKTQNRSLFLSRTISRSPAKTKSMPPLYF